MNKEIKKMILVGLLLVGILIEIGIASAENINPVNGGGINTLIILALILIGLIVVLRQVWHLITGTLKVLIIIVIIILAIYGLYNLFGHMI
jgi:hypothetical protein